MQRLAETQTGRKVKETRATAGFNATENGTVEAESGQI